MGGKHPTGEYNTWKEKQILEKIKNEGVVKKKNLRKSSSHSCSLLKQ